MKKTFLAATLLLMAALGAEAQDTLQSNIPPDRYFYNNWATHEHLMETFTGGSWGGVEMGGKYFYTDTPLKVYGVAACLYTDDFFIGRTLDTSHDLAFEKLALYNACPDTVMLMSEQIAVNIFDSTPALYVKYRLSDGEADAQYTYTVKPFYEVYFDKAVEVQDSFYVGMTFISKKVPVTIDGNLDFYSDRIPLYIGYFLDKSWNIYMPTDQFDRYVEQGAAIEWMGGYVQRHYSHKYGWILMFPILKPRSAGDTPGDTVDVSEVLLERYVDLQPNPAGGRVQLVSSCGLQGVEVYDAAGTKVMELPLTGCAATLDVGTLPAGPYVAKVRTDAGVVTKRLLVAR